MRSIGFISSLLVIVVVLGGLSMLGGIMYQAAVSTEPPEPQRLAIGDSNEGRRPVENITDPARWREVYPETVPMRLGTTTLAVSVADTLSERIQGLSDTPFLPDHVVKLFVYRAPGEHSIWMKDMNYPIDILWLDETGEIVHVEPAVAPETFPDSFASPTPAWYVLEAVAGFAATHALEVGDQLVLPDV